MSKWSLNTILIIGPSEDVRVLYKSLEEYDAKVKAKAKDPDWSIINIGAWINDKFSDKLPEFTEEDYKLSYRNFIDDYTYTEEDADDKEAHLDIHTYSALDDSRMYAFVKLIEVGFPKCIIHYRSEEPGMDHFINTDESGRYFPERWYYYCDKSDYCNSNEDMYRTLINDYANIIKDNNIVIPALIDPEVSRIHKLVDSLIEFDRELYVFQFSIGPEYDDKKVDNIESVGG